MSFQYRLFIGGEFVDAKAGMTFEALSPHERPLLTSGRRHPQ